MSLDLDQLRGLSHAELGTITGLNSASVGVLDELREAILQANHHSAWDSGTRARDRQIHEDAEDFVPVNTSELFELLAAMPTAWQFDLDRWVVASAVQLDWSHVTLGDGLDDRARQALYLAYHAAETKLMEWVDGNIEDDDVDD